MCKWNFIRNNRSEFAVTLCNAMSHWMLFILTLKSGWITTQLLHDRAKQRGSRERRGRCAIWRSGLQSTRHTVISSLANLGKVTVTIIVMHADITPRKDGSSLEVHKIAVEVLARCYFPWIFTETNDRCTLFSVNFFLVTLQTSSATRDLLLILQNKFYWISNRSRVVELVCNVTIFFSKVLFSVNIHGNKWQMYTIFRECCEDKG